MNTFPLLEVERELGVFTISTIFLPAFPELMFLLVNWDTGSFPLSSHPCPRRLQELQDCVEHINRIARVLAQPRGNLLLVGVGGSGRSSCAKICGLAQRWVADRWVIPGLEVGGMDGNGIWEKTLRH